MFCEATELAHRASPLMAIVETGDIKTAQAAGEHLYELEQS